MFCSRCGATIEGTPSYCRNCGAPVAAVAAATPAFAGAGTAGALPVSAAPATYGGFWRRFWATMIDGIVLNVATFPVSLIVSLPMSSRFENLRGEDLSPDHIAALMGTWALLAAFATVISWLYFALLHSSPRQATVGMMALGIQLTDLQGRRVSFARATGRLFASFLSGMTLFIGYLVMLFTERRQTLHDLIAGTLVMRKAS